MEIAGNSRNAPEARVGVIMKCTVGSSVTRILKIGFQARTFFEC